MSDTLNWPSEWPVPPERVIEYTNDGKKSKQTVYLGELEGAAGAAITVTGTAAGTLYGGCRKSDLDSDVWLYVDGGKKVNLYGGGDGGSVGSVFLCLNAGTLGTVYGGGRGGTVDSIRVEVRGGVTATGDLTLGGSGDKAAATGDAAMTVAAVEEGSAFAGFTKTLNGSYRAVLGSGKATTARGDLTFSGSTYTMRGKLKNWGHVRLSGSAITFDRFSSSSAANVDRWEIDGDAQLTLAARSVTVKSAFSGAGALALAGKFTFSGDNSDFVGTVSVAAGGRVEASGGAFFGGTVELGSKAQLQFTKGDVTFSGDLTGDASTQLGVKGGTVRLLGDNSGFLGEYRIGSKGVLEVANDLPTAMAFTLGAANATLLLTGPALPDEEVRTALTLSGNGGTVMLGGNKADLAGYAGKDLTLYGGSPAAAKADFTLSGSGSAKQVLRRIVTGGRDIAELNEAEEVGIRAEVSALRVKQLLAGGENVDYGDAVVRQEATFTDITAGTIYLGGIGSTSKDEFNSQVTLSGGSAAMLYGAGWKNSFGSRLDLNATITDGRYKQIYAAGGHTRLTGGSVTLTVAGGTVDQLDLGGFYSNLSSTTVSVEITGGLVKNVSGGRGDTTMLGGVKLTIAGGTVGGIRLGGIANSGQYTTYELTIEDEGFVKGDIYAGGSVEGWGGLNSVYASNVIIEGGLVQGSVFGGGHAVGFSAVCECSSSSVTVNGGTVTGDVYAGGYVGSVSYLYCVGGRTVTIGADAVIGGDIYAGNRGKGGAYCAGVVITLKEIEAEDIFAGYTGTIDGAYDVSTISYGGQVKGRANLDLLGYRATFRGTLMNLGTVTVDESSAATLRWDPAKWKNIDAFEIFESSSLTFAATGDSTIKSGFSGEGKLCFAEGVTYTLTSNSGRFDGAVTLKDAAALRLEGTSLYAASGFELGEGGSLALLASGTVTGGIAGGAASRLAVSGKNVTIDGDLTDFAGGVTVSGGTLTVTSAAWETLAADIRKGTLSFTAAGGEVALDVAGGTVFAGGQALTVAAGTISGGCFFAGARGDGTIESAQLDLAGGTWSDTVVVAGGCTGGSKQTNTVESSAVTLTDAVFAGGIVAGGDDARGGTATVGKAVITLAGATDFTGSVQGGADETVVVFSDFTGRFDGDLKAIDGLTVSGVTSLSFVKPQRDGASIGAFTFSLAGRTEELRDTAMLTVGAGDKFRIADAEVLRTVDIDRDCFAGSPVGDETSWLLLTGTDSLAGRAFTVGGLSTAAEEIVLLCDGDAISINDESYRLAWRDGGLYLCGTVGTEGQTAMHWSAVLDHTGAPLAGPLYTGGALSAADYGYEDAARQISLKAVVSGTSGDVGATGDIEGSLWLNIRASGGAFTGLSGGTAGGDVTLYFEDDAVWDSLLVAADDAWVTGDAAITIASGEIRSLAIAREVGPGEDERTARVAAAAVELAGGAVRTLDGAGTDAGTKLIFSASYEDLAANVSTLAAVDLAGNELQLTGGAWSGIDAFDFGAGGRLVFASGLAFEAGAVTGEGAIDVQTGAVDFSGDLAGFKGDLTLAEGGTFNWSWSGPTAFAGAVSGAGDLVVLGSGTFALTGDLEGYAGSGFRAGDDTTLVIESAFSGDLRIEGGDNAVIGLADYTAGDGALTVVGAGANCCLFAADVTVASCEGTLIYGGCRTSAGAWEHAARITLTLDDSIYAATGFQGSFLAAAGKDGRVGDGMEHGDGAGSIRLTLVDGYAFDVVSLGGRNCQVAGDAILVMEGGTVNTLAGAGYNCQFENDIYLSVTGGTIGTLYGGDLGRTGSIMGNITVDLTTAAPEEGEEAAGIRADTIHLGGVEAFSDSDGLLTIDDGAGAIEITGDIWLDNVLGNATAILTASVAESGFALYGGTIHGCAEQSSEEAIGSRKLTFKNYSTGYAGSFIGLDTVAVDETSGVTLTGASAVFRADVWEIAGDITFAGGPGSKLRGVTDDNTPSFKGEGNVIFAADFAFGARLDTFEGALRLETTAEAPLTTVTISTSELPETLKIGGKGAAALTGHPASLTVKGSFESGSELWLTNNTATLSGTFGTVAMGALDSSSSDESVTLTFACGSGVTVTGGITGANTDSTSTVLFTGVGSLSLAGAIDGGTASVRTLAFTQYAGTISLDAAPVTNFDTLSLAGDAVLVFTGGAAASGVTEYAFDLTKRSAGFASSVMATFRDTPVFDPTASEASISLILDAAALAADTAYLLIRCDGIAALSGRTVAASFADGRTAALEIDGEAWYDEADDRWWQLTADTDTGALALYMRSEALASSELLLAAPSPFAAEEEKEALAGMLAQA